MAYGAKYILPFSDVYQNTTQQYTATIYKQGYIGASIFVSGQGSPLTIETDRSGESSYRPFISSKATLNLLFENLDTFNIDEFITSEPDTFYLELKAGSTVIWKGYYISTSDISISEVPPIQISLQFSDISLAKINRFYNFQPLETDKLVKYNASEKKTLLDVIARFTYFSGIYDNVKINFESPLANRYYRPSTVPFAPYVETILTLDKLFIQSNAFLTSPGVYDNYFNILSGICSQYGLIAYFKNGSLYISDYNSLLQNSSRSYKRYNITGYDLSTDTVSYTLASTATESDQVIALNSSTFKNVGRNQSVALRYPSENVVINNKASLNANIPNFNMSSLSNIYNPGGSVTNIIDRWFDSNGNEVAFQYGGFIDPFQKSVFPFTSYRTLKTGPIDTNVGTMITSQPYFRNQPGFGSPNTEYWDSDEIQVTSSDYISFDVSAYLDGRFKNYTTAQQTAWAPDIPIMLLLKAKDENGNDTLFSYNKSTQRFENITISWTTPGFSNYLLTVTRTSNFVGDSDRFYGSLNGQLSVPANGTIKLRFFRPWPAGPEVVGGLTYPRDVTVLPMLEYVNLKTYRTAANFGTTTSQQYKTYYTNVLNSDRSANLDSNAFLLEGSSYKLGPTFSGTLVRRQSPLVVSSYYGNHILDEFNYPAIGASYNYTELGQPNLSYTNLKNRLTAINESILKNQGLVSAEISGTFKSSMYNIGTKFTYQITGYPEKTFCMLDTRNDYKASEQDAILYSINFSDTAFKIVESQTVLS